MAKVTIEDISKATGLSRGTVSRALNNRPDISEKTRLRVIDACQKMNYVRSHAARSLATGRHLAFAALTDDQKSSLTFDVLFGAMRAIDVAGYALQIIEAPADATSAAGRIRALSVAPIDGLLAITTRAASHAVLLAEAMGTRPLASVWPVDGLACDVLTPDYDEAGRLAARHLADQGAKTALFVGDSTEHSAARRGFEHGCGERGVTPQYANTDDIDALRRLVAESGYVACTTTACALAVRFAAERAHRAIDTDLKLVCMADDAIASQISPPLTTINLGGVEIGRRAIEMLLQRLDGERTDQPQLTRVSPRLLTRPSNP